MSVNERDLPQFSAGPLTPIGSFSNSHPLPVATKKQSSSLLKHLMAHAKPASKVKATKGKGRASVRGRTRGIASDQKVHFKTLHKYY